LAHRLRYYFSDAESNPRIVHKLAVPSNQRLKQVLGNVVFDIVTAFFSQKISVWIIG